MENPFEEINHQLQTLKGMMQQLMQNIPQPLSVNPPEEVYTKEAAARLLSISEKTLNSYITKGIIPFCKLETGGVYFLRSDLINWLKGHRRATVSEQLAVYETAVPIRKPRRQQRVA